MIDPTAHVHPLGAVIGNVTIGKNVFVAPFAAVRGDEGQPLHVGEDSNVQDGDVIHALETEEHGKPVEKNLMEVDGKGFLVFGASGLLAGALGMWAYYAALKMEATSKIVPISASYPLVTALLSVLILREGVTLPWVIGTALIVIGIWFV